MTVKDPTVYADERALEATIVLPVRKEIASARFALSALLGLLNDCPLFTEGLSPRDRRRFVRRWTNRFIDMNNKLGFTATLVALSKLGNDFLRSFTFGIAGNVTYNLADTLIDSPIYSAADSLGRIPSSDPRFIPTIKWLYNWHVYLAKIPLTRTDLEDPSETDWVQRQRDVLDIYSFSLDTLDALKMATEYLFDAEVAGPVHGKHGPGSTAGNYNTIPEKEKHMDPSIQTLQLDRNSISRVETLTLLSRPLPNALMFVPKDVKSLRPITMESPAMQYAQQAIKEFIYSSVDDRTVLAGRHITFSDQEPSQAAAIRGSRYGNFDTREATIDLSSASDLLSVDLITQIFSGDLLNLLLSGRSWDTLSVTNGLIELGMYGGMGSALTFPVQTLVFTSICYVAVARALCMRETNSITSSVDAVSDVIPFAGTKTAYWPYFSSIRVFGDDIILPNFAVPELFKLLEELGLRVNKDKSFYNDLVVREACGIYAFAGYDITPVRYRLPASAGLDDAASYEALRAACNHAFYAGYRTLYRLLVRKLKSIKPLMNKDERGKSRGLYNGRGRKRSKAETLLYFSCEVLFEPERSGPEGHIGVVSRRPITQGSVQIVHGEPRLVQCSFAARDKADVDNSSELYHYEQELWRIFKRDRDDLEYVERFVYDDIPASMHGRIPDKVRLVKRAAYLREYEGVLGWAWVPS
jgi:hypothetical protein